MARKNLSAVAPGRKSGKKGGPARAARLTAEQRSERARRAVQARWAKANGSAIRRAPPIVDTADTSDSSLAALLRRLKTTSDLDEIRHLSDRIERVIFHRQFTNA